MNILKIFGIVVAVHITAFLFVFAIPGCRSTTHRSSDKKPLVESKETVIRLPGTATPQRPPPIEATAPVSPVLPVAEASPTSGSTIVFPSARANPVRPESSDAQAFGTVQAPEPKTYTVAPKDSLWSIAKKFGVSEKDLASANKLKSGSPLRVGQTLTIPVPPGMGPGESVAAPTPTFTYKVRSGESLALIAKRAGITTTELKTMNNLQSDIVRVGQELTLPAAASAPKPEAPKPTKPGTIRHTVKAGESLGGIARKYGVPLREIATLNHIANPAALRVGAELIIPTKGNAPIASTPASSPAPASAAVPEATTSRPVASAPVAAPTPTPVPKFEIPLIGPAPAESSPISPSTDVPPVNAVEDSGLVTPSKE